MLALLVLLLLRRHPLRSAARLPLRSAAVADIHKDDQQMITCYKYTTT